MTPRPTLTLPSQSRLYLSLRSSSQNVHPLSPVSQITKEQIETYKQELTVFADGFNMHGPGAVGDNLEKGKC